MNDSENIPSLERPAFFNGQRLTAADLDAAQTYHRELRWLHNRSLHGWGIASGFAVSGARGAQAVRVLPGYAIDCLGRDLVLDLPLDLPIPAVAGAGVGSPAGYYLTISYADDARLGSVTRAGACDASGAVRRSGAPAIRWQDPADSDPLSRYRNGLDVVLGEIRVQNCRLAAGISGRERRDALPPPQPYIAAGRTEVGKTIWQLWPDDNAALGVTTTVSTSEAGFRVTPRYQAHVVGKRRYPSLAREEPVMVDGYAQVAQATASSFELRMILPSGSTAGTTKADTFTMDDYAAVVSRIVNEKEVSANLIQLSNGPGLAVGQHLYTPLHLISVLGPILDQLIGFDFQHPLQQIASRNGISLAALLSVNGWDLNKVALMIGQSIAIPGPGNALNTSEFFKPEFMETLKNDLAWHVVWMGVEG